jgi:hypothetical protein
VDPTALLPPDNSTQGFDNVAGALGVSSALVERYVSAASKVSRMAIGDAETPVTQTTYTAPIDLTQDHHAEGLPFGTRGGMRVDHHFPADATYRFVVTFLRDYNGVLFGGNTTGEQLEISVDGERVHLVDLDTEVESEGFTEITPLEMNVDVSAGPHSIGLAFVQQSYGPVEDVFQPFLRSTVSLTVTKEWTVLPHVGSVTVVGPYGVTGVADTPSRERIFECLPRTAAEEQPCATEIIRTLASRAFRRAATEADVESILPFYDQGHRKSGFEGGIEMALRRILSSPEFIFRFERDTTARDGENVAISGLELASRLSFFLWSSVPDEELIGVAVSGDLQNPATLEAQVRRMLADARSFALVENFAGQWLYLRNLASITPSLDEFPDFDDNLRQAFREETELFFESVVGEDRSVIDLLTADYTFVNERLARHYGIDGINGSHFRRVSLDGTRRRGLLGQGSVLMATSYATRTSPVLRGKWVLENLLGTPPPEPPPDVPALEERTRADVALGSVTLRELLEAHRANPACTSCHRMMDPIGFALENFDAVGAWRDKDGRTPIDASGQLADGAPLDGPESLRTALVGYSDQFVRTVTEKLLTYALGRGTDYRDMPVVREIVRDAADEDYRFSALVMGIVSSPPFQWRSSVERDTLAEGDR